GTGQRPFTLAAPLVAAHHEEADRGLVEHTGVDVLQPVVVPAQLVGPDETRGAAAEVNATDHRRHLLLVRPGPDQQPVRASGRSGWWERGRISSLGGRGAASVAAPSTRPACMRKCAPA